MKILALILLSIAITLTGCSDKDAIGLDTNSVEAVAASQSADIETKDGYEKVITKPLVKLDDCKFIVEGTIEYRLEGEVVAVVDYGDGECDNIATKTVDGVTEEFELDEKDSNYDKIITNPLVKLEDCDYIVAGTIEFSENGVWAATVDFGDGTCDEWATKTWDGGSEQFSLRK